MLCYIGNSLKDVLFMSADSAAIPAEVGGNFDLVYLINDTALRYKFVILV